MVDGYSLLHYWEELAPTKPRHSFHARDALVASLTQYQDSSGTPVTVVFDGGGAPPDTPKNETAKGGIEDADFALETTNLAKNQILQQASTAMLAQANASKQNVLSLLQG